MFWFLSLLEYNSSRFQYELSLLYPGSRQPLGHIESEAVPEECLWYNLFMQKKSGRIIIPGNTDVWDHEMFSAKALARAGYEVRFNPRDEINQCADAYVNGVLFEFKSPTGKNIACVERNLKRGTHQSENIVITSWRIHRVQDRSICNYLKTKLKIQPTLKKVIFVNRLGEAIDINKLIK